MVLGNPHFPWRGRYRFEQVQLTIPGTYDVAGASLIGSPVINIGWNRDVAWSHTVSTAYRFTPYEYKLARQPDDLPHRHGPQAAPAPHGRRSRSASPTARSASGTEDL